MEVEVLRCGSCHRSQLPPKYACRFCGGRTLSPGSVGPQGSVVTYTVIRVPPAAFEGDAPYVVLLAELAEGIRLTGRLADGGAAELSIGEPVMLLQRDTVGYWFRRGS